MNIQNMHCDLIEIPLRTVFSKMSYILFKNIGLRSLGNQDRLQVRDPSMRDRSLNGAGTTLNQFQGHLVGDK